MNSFQKMLTVTQQIRLAGQDDNRFVLKDRCFLCFRRQYSATKPLAPVHPSLQSPVIHHSLVALRLRQTSASLSPVLHF